MPSELAARVVEVAREECDVGIRSVMEYEPDEWELVYIRDGVADGYDGWQLDAVAQDARMESLATDFVERLYHEHGGYVCNIKWFARAIEINLRFSEARGALIAVDQSHFRESTADFHRFVDRLTTAV